MSYKQQSEKTKKLGDRGIRSVPEYEGVPAIPVSVKVRDLDMFYRVVNLLNSSVGKGKWNGPRKIVRQFRIRERDAQPDFTYAPIQVTFMVPDDKVSELKLLLKFME